MSSSIAIDPLRAPSRRATGAALASLAVHLLVLLLAARIPLRLPEPESDRIFVTLARAAAPPPPPLLNDVPGPQTSAPEWWERAEPEPRPKPRPVVKPKQAIRAKDRPKPKEPDEKPVAAPEPPSAIASTTAPGPPAGGAVGGVAGGQPGGKVGGILGGTGDSVYHLDQVASPPRIVDRVMPKYPSQARAQRLEGVVVLEAVIDRGGRVEPAGLHVVQSKDPFDVAAVEAFRRWRFEPARDNGGKPVRVLVRQAIRFELR